MTDGIDFINHPLNSKPKIKWFAVWGGQRFPREKSMRGMGWDATCSCGWDSKTGGALESSVKRDIANHKLDHEVYQEMAAKQAAKNENLGRQFE